jgi:hypothetical protein
LKKAAGAVAAAVDTSLDWLGRKLGAWLRQQIPGHEPFVSSDPAAFGRSLRPADVLLVAGGNRLSTAIKYLTQSTWSHAALYVGNAIVAPANAQSWSRQEAIPGDTGVPPRAGSAQALHRARAAAPRS